MAEQKKTNEALNVEDALTQSEAFLIKNKKAIIGAVLAIVIIVAGVVMYKNLYAQPREEKAQAALFKGQEYFEADKYEQALNGDSIGYKGFLKVAEEYSGTDAANLAKAYAGLCYAHLGKYEEALKALDSFSGNDQLVAPAMKGAMGNCYAQLGQLDKAVSLLLQAAEEANSNAISPIYLQQAGEILVKQGKYDDAINAYTTIKEKYFRSYQSMNIDKYIEAPSPMAFPVFDILTTRSRRDKYKSSNTYNGENWELYDYYPCLRFVGPAPSDPYRWSFLIYFYSHRKNKKYKLLFEVPLSECEMPEGWSNNAYQTVVLPVSLMRLFWDLFDPTATGTNKFHGAGYIPGTIASEWMSVCATGKSISKRSCSVGVTPRAHGAYYSGSFGIRLISVPGQIYGEMHKFKISLFNHPVSILSERSNILRFSIKMHSGNVTQTLR